MTKTFCRSKLPYFNDLSLSSSLDSSVSSSDSEEEEYDSLDACLDAYSLAEFIRGQSNNKKRQRTGSVPSDLRPIAFIRFNSRRGKPRPITIKALLDSGASESLVLKKHVKHLKVKSTQKSKTIWTTPAGDLATSPVLHARIA